MARPDRSEHIDGAARILEERAGGAFDAMLVLGSGLGGLAGALDDAVELPFEDLPGFPRTAVAGHGGRFVAGALEGRRVLAQAGRYHLYEGHDPRVVAAPVRLAARVGVRSLLLTNAAGSLDPRRGAPGSLILLDDHLNLGWRSPLPGSVAPGEDRFPDMSEPYDRGLQSLFLEVARQEGIRLERGTYAWVTGPSYETPAEIAMLRRMGAHVVGMSTVPEVLAARALQLPVAAVSLVTNLAAGLSPEPLSHEEVLRAGREAADRVERLVRGMVARLPVGPGPAEREA